ncbi:hypothetical protein E2C01_026696 [Portunus trituberculatus]|uniref:Uncharacterized protein n=1 Tax=Portunus trituberculatus TaxID=210409 RepID=A0A5B7EJL8_PORTR|nr:hypothetical protein [Portunus trituberculatus]
MRGEAPAVKLTLSTTTTILLIMVGVTVEVVVVVVESLFFQLDSSFLLRLRPVTSLIFYHIPTSFLLLLWDATAAGVDCRRGRGKAEARQK